MSSISPYFSYAALTWWQPTDRATRFRVKKNILALIRLTNSVTAAFPFKMPVAGCHGCCVAFVVSSTLRFPFCLLLSSWAFGKITEKWLSFCSEHIILYLVLL